MRKFSVFTLLMTTTYSLFLLSLAKPAPAMAQTSVWGSDKGVFREPAKADQPPALGWHRSGEAAVNFSLMSSQDVVGQTDGTSQTYGLNLKSSLNHFRQHDEWRNDFSLTESTTKTASIPRFVKSSDELKLSTIYVRYLENYPKVGPYARAEAAAPLFKGEDVRAEAKTYRITGTDGSSSTQQGTSLRLTDGFLPLATKEAVGFFYKPIKEEKLQVEARLGAAALQIKAAGGYSVKGVNAAGEVDVHALNDVNQAGLELGLDVKGKFSENAGYELALESLTPFINDSKAGDNRDAFRLTNIDGTAKLVSKINEWASMSYDYKLKIQPQLVDRAQQIHMFVLNINFPPAGDKK